MLSLLYLDLIFNVFTYDNYLITSVINIVLFDIVVAIFINILTSIFSEKANRIITCILYFTLWFWYGLHYVIYHVLATPFSMALLRQSDQPLSFGSDVIRAILSNIHVLLLLILPAILMMIFKKKFDFSRIKLKGLIIYICLFFISIGVYIGNMFIQEKGVGSPYNLYYETNNVSLNIERLGILSATYLDIKRTLFGINEKIIKVDTLEEEPITEEVIPEYSYNVLNIDISNNNGNIGVINRFVRNESGSKQNEYTGMFKGKNLIYIVAESFSEIAVSEELTPTLYKLVHDGFYFKNFYTSNNLSTIGGEFQALTGLYADNTILSSWRGGRAYYPYGLGTVFGNLGYNTHAYHDHYATFQDRNIYLKTQGFNNFKACYSGLEKLINCNQWPESDVEMIKATLPEYINSETPFMTYYMTVSGHMHYNFAGNMIASKNKEYVKDLNYPEVIKGYIATQIELDKALELLLDELEKANKLDDTVIVLLADHYPYDLSVNDINKISTYERDSLIEVNSNALIIYNNQVPSTEISKVGMSIDVIPTVLNLFGVDYDSRVIMGKDILSTTEGIAIFKNKSWVTNKGTYYAATGKFVATEEEIPEDYINTINSIVANRVAISRMIVENNYYKYVFNK